MSVVSGGLTCPGFAMQLGDVVSWLLAMGKGQLVLGILGIVAIAYLERLAILAGVDGAMLALAVAAVAGIAGYEIKGWREERGSK